MAHTTFIPLRRITPKSCLITYLGLTDIDFKNDANRRYGIEGANLIRWTIAHSALQANLQPLSCTINLLRPPFSLIANDFHRELVQTTVRLGLHSMQNERR